MEYRGYKFSLNNVVIEDFKKLENEMISYIVELSTNPINYNGENKGAYIYLEIAQKENLQFSGLYNTDEKNFYTRSLDYIEFHVDPSIRLNEGVDEVYSSTYSVYDDYFTSGSIYLNNYQSGRLETNFTMTDEDSYKMTGSFKGLFEYIQHFSKISKVSSNP